MDLSGGTGKFKASRLERLFRDARYGRFHPANSALVHEIVGKTALGIDLANGHAGDKALAHRGRINPLTAPARLPLC